tara:strand:+ start:1256 stop:1864 length:609 start_codon:yes stop_codon:yes gene_type:complete
MSEELGFTVDYSKLTKEQLIQLCEQNGLGKSGSKADLLERLNQLTDSPTPKVEEKIRVKCPSCSQSLFVPSGHAEELKCPSCSVMFDPRVSSFVRTHGVKINVQDDSERQLFVSVVAGLYFSSFLIGGFLLEIAWDVGNEGCLCCMLGIFWSLPFVGFSAAYGDSGSYRTPMLVLFGFLSLIHTIGLLGFIILLSQFAGSGF